jgi:cysteine synthase A
MTELVGDTPLLHLARLEAAYGIGGGTRLLGKLESFNPGGSVKDRVALAMIEAAEKDGRLQPGGTVIEPTSGNTGIGLAAACAQRGYKLIICMPETMSIERRQLMAAYGAELVLTPGAAGMSGAIARASELAAATPGSIVAGQFVNPANPAIHYATTGPEIWEATGGEVDVLVAGVGTGGTISGAGTYLKEHNPNIKVLAVEPVDSPVLSAGTAGPHKLQGIGAGFVPETLDTSVYDAVATVGTEQAFEAARAMARQEGMLVGISSGAALWAAIEEAKNADKNGRTIVVILPDTGERYLSTPLFA